MCDDVVVVVVCESSARPPRRDVRPADLLDADGALVGAAGAVRRGDGERAVLLGRVVREGRPPHERGRVDAPPPHEREDGHAGQRQDAHQTWN